MVRDRRETRESLAGGGGTRGVAGCWLCSLVQRGECPVAKQKRQPRNSVGYTIPGLARN